MLVILHLLCKIFSLSQNQQQKKEKLTKRALTNSERDFLMKCVHIDGVKAIQRIYKIHRNNIRFYPRRSDGVLSLILRATSELKYNFKQIIKDFFLINNTFQKKSFLKYKNLLKNLKQEKMKKIRETSIELENLVRENAKRCDFIRKEQKKKRNIEITRLKQCFKNYLIFKNRNDLERCIHSIGQEDKKVVDPFSKGECCRIESTL
ncbi:hypothetical protein M153_12970001442 [Pseudoloma neurophilia]|uniref:Uncharacterized protein n=1 Tax=Pseudoloma neurophilia TaxID=146866 RepID=A0A0R0M2G4_9MICR|nr:hypothetical protein M153_12970001442 [Pseudoloma neurophilia]